MNILTKETAEFSVDVKNRHELLNHIANKFFANKSITNKEIFIQKILEREEQVSTALVKDIAIPHVQIPEVVKPFLGYFKLKNVINWDGKHTVKAVFVIAVPKKAQADHLTILASLSKALIDEKNIIRLLAAKNYEEFKAVFSPLVTSTDSSTTEKKDSYDIVAVASCPSGIAHTYMAAESLIVAAKELGFSIKVETQGADMVENQLSAKDIENAKAIVLALDRAILMDRFGGRKVYEISSGKAITKGQEVLKAALAGEGKYIKEKNTGSILTPKEQPPQKFTFSKGALKEMANQGYKALLTGVSYMIPFVVFGGIIVALSFLIDINNSGNSTYGTGNEVARWFNHIGGFGFALFVPAFAAYIAHSIVGKVGIMPGFIIGFIANGKLYSYISGDKTVGFFGENVSASGFLGAIIGAYIVALVVIMFRKVLYKAPKQFHGPIALIWLPIFSTLVAGAAMWLINIPLGIANKAITDGLSDIAKNGPVMIGLGLLIGGMMAFDMGGPVNKAAYTFGVLSIDAATNHDSAPMAQVMLGGMLPPLGLAFSTTFFPKLWNKEEREIGASAWIFGVSFITEGAIPFAAKRPKVIIPSIVMGSAFAAMILGLFSIGDGVTLAAPQGGIFVFPLIKYGGNIGIGVAAYIFCLIIGCIAIAAAVPLMRKVTGVKIIRDPNADNIFRILWEKIGVKVPLPKIFKK